MSSERSPFRAIPPEEWLAQNRSGFAVWDKFPVSHGHALVVPFRQITSWWDTVAEEQSDLWSLVREVKSLIDKLHAPDGYNVGFNDGPAAGQTVQHLHLHLIPRYAGNTPDPQGGLRHVLPASGSSLPGRTPPELRSPDNTTSSHLLNAPNDAGRLRLELIRCLRSPGFDHVDLVVSFIMRSGLRMILSAVDDAIARGAIVRVLTTDYLDITDPDALAELLDLQEASTTTAGQLDLRVWRATTESFHPKAYIFWSTTGPLARGFVGSSNLSKSGIDGGVEWNLSISEVDQLRQGFEQLWTSPQAVALDHDLLRSYRARRKIRPAGAPEPAAIGVEIEPPRQPVAPTEIQVEALRALEATRLEGYRAGLVVMATGLGKTWLAAFDSSRPAVRRTLFVAHREEILRQSVDVFRQVRPEAELGMFAGQEKEPDADVVFASVQTLHRRLEEFDRDAFDYIVMDEFHHAAASTYRKVLDYFEAPFLLGLTATPDRLDGADLLALCGDNLVFECDLVTGIRRGQLSTFHYLGLRDSTDFEPIPWRNGKFDPAALAQAIETSDRADQALDAWRTHGGGPTLGFCCSITHAEYMANHFTANGLGAVAVHSGPASAPRRQSITQLRARELDVVFAVDVFNEGVDVPEIETVMMLRPTDSPIVFLQQLGRGLRNAKGTGKQYLQVIDFIGNHRSFLTKPRTLLSLGGRTTPTTSQVLEAMRLGEFDLPEGCSVAYELEAVDLLASLVKKTKLDALADYCLDYTDEHGFRPTAIQALRAGMNPSSARRQHGQWFGLLQDLELLTEHEQAVMGPHGQTLRAIEQERITKSYKLVTLRALLHDDALRSGAPVSQIAATAHQLVMADPRLVADVTGTQFPKPRLANAAEWEAFWRKWPLEHMTGDGDSLFRLEDDRLEPRFEVVDQLGETFDAMVAELLEWRLADYLLRTRSSTDDAMRCKLIHSGGKPLLVLDRERHPDLPEGWTEVTANDEPVRLNFVKMAVNAAERPGEQGNALHDLLRGWFGPSAGLPGTQHAVVLRHSTNGWELRPERIAVPELAEVVPLFPTYDVACGAFDAPDALAEVSHLTVIPNDGQPIDPTRHFIAFAAGESMNGGPDPITQGDPLLFEWARDVSRAALVDHRVLVQQTTTAGPASALKRLHRDGSGWLLTSDATGHAPIAGSTDMRIAATLVNRLDQAAINPLSSSIGEQFNREKTAELFGEEWNWGRWGQVGHVTSGSNEVLFVTLDKATMRQGAEYDDHFEGRDRMIWASQNAVGPETKRGVKLLGSPGNGQLVHLLCRRTNDTPSFTYCGIVIPLSHEGAKPMSVTFRLLTPLTPAIDSELTPGTPST